LSAYSKVLHRPGKLLPTVQRLLPRHLVIVKWKCLRRYELLNSRKKFAFSIGPLASITYSTVFQVRPCLGFGLMVQFLIFKLWGHSQMTITWDGGEGSKNKTYCYFGTKLGTN